MCESSDKTNAIHYNKNGTVDTGPLQINSVHKPQMEALGYDYYDWRDSVRYGVLLASTSGLKPWDSSSKCWR